LAKYLGALDAYYDAVILRLSAFLDRYTWYGKPIHILSPMLELSTSGALEAPLATVILSVPRTVNNLSGESKPHNNPLPSTYDWKQNGLGHYILHHGEEEAEIWIIPRHSLGLLNTSLKLKHPIFHIHFFAGHMHLNVADMPTLREAKKIAESYYALWLKVKDDPKQTEMYANVLRLTPQSADDYPLAEIAGGLSGKTEGSHNGRDHGSH
jgi:uncharacterized Zn-finger protein